MDWLILAGIVIFWYLFWKSSMGTKEERQMADVIGLIAIIGFALFQLFK